MTSRKRSYQASFHDDDDHSDSNDGGNRSNNNNNNNNNSNNSNGGVNSAVERKRRQIQQASWGLLEVLAECGLVEFQNDNNSSNNIVNNINNNLGCQIESTVSSSSLRSSIHALLEEMDRHGIDPGNERVKNSLEEFIDSCHYFDSCNDDDDDDDDDGGGKSGGKENDYDDHHQNNGNATTTTTTTTTTKTSLRKLLLPMYKLVSPAEQPHLFMSQQTNGNGIIGNMSQSPMQHYHPPQPHSPMQLSQSPIQRQHDESPMHHHHHQDQQQQQQQQREKVIVKESSSLIKILLKIDVLQPTLLTLLLQKLPEVAMAMAMADENNGEESGITNYYNGNGNDNHGVGGSNSGSNDAGRRRRRRSNGESGRAGGVTTIAGGGGGQGQGQDIPRLIYNNIRWLDHIVDPHSLVTNFCEMLTVLSSSSSSSSDALDSTLNSNDDNVVRGILLDGIACLPDVLGDCASLMEDIDVTGNGKYDDDGDDENGGDNDEDQEDNNNNNNDNPILSTLQLLRIEDPSLLIPCLDAIGSLPLSDHQLRQVTRDALEALASVDVWGLPALTTFLMNNCPSGSGGGYSGSGNLAKEVIEEIRKLPLGSYNHSIANDTNNPNQQQTQSSQKTKPTTVDTEALMIESLTRGFTHRSDLTATLFKSIKETPPGHHLPADIWLLACCANAPHHLTQVKSIFRSKANHGGFTSQLVHSALKGNGMALQSLFQNSFCELADGLLRSSDASVELGITLYALLFREFREPMQRQEVVGSLVTSVGSGVGVKVEEVDAAMKVFSNILDGRIMAMGADGSRGRRNDREKKDEEDGAVALRPFAPFLISMLDHLHHLTTTQVRRLFLLLFGVCGDWNDEEGSGGGAGGGDAMMSSSGRMGGGACDDVYIVIRKHLSLPSFAKKKIGIIGAVAYAVSRSSKLLEIQSSMDDENMADTEETRLGGAAAVAVSPAIKDIKDMINTAYSHCKPSGVTSLGFINRNQSNNHIPANVGSAFSEGSAVAFMLDELCHAVRGGRLVEPIRDYLNELFQGEFESVFVGDLEEPGEGKKGTTDFDTDCTPSGFVSLLPTNREDLALVQGNSTNKLSPPGEIRLCIEGSDVMVYVKMLSLLSSYNSIERELLPVQLCPMFRLMATINDMRYGGEGLSEIDAMLECPMLLPCTEASGIEFDELSSMKQWVVTSSYFFATCWVRELINSFIYAAASAGTHQSQQTSSQGFNANDVRKKLVARLKSLVELEEELRFTSSKCYVFTAPGLDILPPPKELFDDGSAERNADSLFSNVENTSSNIDSSNMSKEDKKANAAAKKLASKRAKLREKTKHARIKAKAKYEEALCTRTMAALRPLDPQVCVALGFEELCVMSNTGGTYPSQQLSQLQSIQVGGPVTSLLLSLLDNALADLFTDNKGTSFKARFGQSSDNDTIEGDNDNPYLIQTTTNNATSIAEVSLSSCDNTTRNCFLMLDVYLRCGVFASMFEHLAGIIELRGGVNRQTSSESDRHLTKTARCLFSCVRTLIGAGELTRSRTGKQFLFSILRQLSEGDRDDYQTENALRRQPNNSVIIRLLTDLFCMIEEIIVGAHTDDLDFVMDGITCLDAIFKCSRRVSDKDDAPASIEANSTGEKPDNIPNKLSKVSQRLLRQSWPSDTKMNKSNVGKLLVLFFEHSIIPISSDVQQAAQTDTENLGRMKTLTLIVNDVLEELTQTEKCKGPVDLFPTCQYSSFGSYYSVVFQYLQKELVYLFDSSLGKTKDQTMALKTVDCVTQLTGLLQTLFDLTRNNAALAKKAFLLQELKWGSRFIETFVAKVIPFFHIHFQNHQEAILDVIKRVQRCARQLYAIISHGKREKDSNLTKEAPRAKKALEMFIHKIKSLLKKNNCMSAMTAKDLKLKDIDGTTLQDERENARSAHDDAEEDGEDSGMEDEEDEDSDGSGSAIDSENEYETDEE